MSQVSHCRIELQIQKEKTRMNLWRSTGTGGMGINSRFSIETDRNRKMLICMLVPLPKMLPPPTLLIDDSLSPFLYQPKCHLLRFQTYLSQLPKTELRFFGLNFTIYILFSIIHCNSPLKTYKLIRGDLFHTAPSRVLYT